MSTATEEKWLEICSAMESPDIILLVEQIVRAEHTRLDQWGQPLRQFWREVADWMNSSQSTMRHPPMGVRWTALNGCLAAAYSYMDNHVKTTDTDNPCRYQKCPVHEHEEV